MPKGIVAPDRVRTFVERLAKKEGTERASEELKVSRETIARVIAGLPVHTATVSHIELKMQEQR